MEFSKEFLANKMFIQHALSFDRLSKGRKYAPDAGYEIMPNGDVALRVYAPNAKCVRAEAWADKVSFTRRDDGMFEGVLPYDEKDTGPRTVNIYIDEALVLSPYLPIYWTEDRPCNFVEMPDEAVDFAMVKDVPHGMMLHATFWAEATGDWERCTVYTPPGYMNGTDSYPVLYLQNGGSDNETSWEYSGRVANIMDNLIAEGKAVPMLIVMNNAMLRAGGEISNFRDRALESIIVDSCIPYIEQNFRVKTDKWNRAIAGLSMGAYMSNDIGFWHPELFGYIGGFTASMTTTETWERYERPWPQVLKAAQEDITTFSDKYKVFHRSTTTLENHFEFFEADDELCARAGIDKLDGYYRFVYPPTTSKWQSWRMGIRDFAQEIFK